MYASVADLRAEGVTETQADDERLAALIEEASRLIDRVTGWFFMPRLCSFRLDGRGAPTIEPPSPPIELDTLAVSGSKLSLVPESVLVVGAPAQPGFDGPRITLRHGRSFPKGNGNVHVEGTFGYTEEDGTSHGRTPLEIRRACMMLVLRGIPLLADSESTSDAKSRWRIIEERTRDQSYRLDRDGRPAPLTGDPDVDAILARFRRPPAMGAA